MRRKWKEQQRIRKTAAKHADVASTPATTQQVSRPEVIQPECSNSEVTILPAPAMHGVGPRAGSSRSVPTEDPLRNLSRLFTFVKRLRGYVHTV